MLVLQGRTVRLRDFTDGDADAFVELCDDELMFSYMKFRFTPDEVLHRYMPLVLRETQLYPRPTFNFVVDGSDGFAGWAAIGGMQGGDRAEFGWYLRSDHWGRGYGTEATRLLLDFGFALLGRCEMYATCDPENVASRRVLEKSGLAYQGLTDPVITWRGERPRLLFTLTKHEWSPKLQPKS